MSSKEYCFGCEVSADKPEYVWDPEGYCLEDNDSDSETKGFGYSLILKHAILDAGCADGEVNVVVLETNNFFSEVIKQPVFSLVNGRTEQLHMDILVTEPFAKLTLVKGSGPVYIWGQLIVELENEEDEGNFDLSSYGEDVKEDEDENEDDNEEEGEEVGEDEIEDIIKDAAKNKKEGISTKNKKGGVMAKNGGEDTTSKKRKTSDSKPVYKKAKLSATGIGAKKEENESDDDNEENDDEKDDDDDVNDNKEEEGNQGKENVKTPKTKTPSSSVKKSIKKKQRLQKNKRQ